MTGYHVADERFPPGSNVTVDDFEPGDWHVCRDWPEHVPEVLRGSVHIAGHTAAGVLGEAWVHPDRLHIKEEEAGEQKRDIARLLAEVSAEAERERDEPVKWYGHDDSPHRR